MKTFSEKKNDPKPKDLKKSEKMLQTKRDEMKKLPENEPLWMLSMLISKEATEDKVNIFRCKEVKFFWNIVELNFVTIIKM